MATKTDRGPGTPSNTLDEIAGRLTALLPEGSERLADDVRRNLRAALSDALARMELVTRDEYEVQRALLLRTREKLTSLEQQVRDLEEILKNRTT